MRICIVDNLHEIKDNYSGAVNRILNLANNISKNNVDTFIIDENNKFYYEINIQKINIKKYTGLINFYVFKFILRLSVKLLKLIFSRKEEIQYLPNMLNFILLLKIYYVVKKEKIDIIQAEFPPSFLSSYIIAKLFNKKIIFQEHNIESIRLIRANSPKRLTITIKFFEVLFSKLSNSVFTVSEVDKRILLSWKISSSKVHVIPNSVDVQKFVPIINANNIKNKYDLKFPTLIFHGVLNYSPNKAALDILVNIIFPKIKEKYPDAKLLVVGHSPPEICEKNIIVTGPVDNLQEYIAAADIAIVPIMSGGGTRIKILEYMAMGKPVISTKIGAEGIEARNGVEILISENIDDSFMQMIMMTISDSNLRKNLGVNARKLVVEKYTWENTAKKALEIYKQIYFHNIWN